VAGAFFMSLANSIGFFDSGVGGLTIWNDVVQLLPSESTIYLADSANAPYGSKSPEEIQRLSINNTQTLISLGAKIIVVACNTATTQSIKVLREKFSVPFIGIEPAVKPASLNSRLKSIGVLATAGTIESAQFNRTKNDYSADVKVFTQVGEGLVTAIEKGELNKDSLNELLKKHLTELIQEPIDTLVLGCTHYPLLIPVIKQIIGDKISILDSGKPVAIQTQKILSSMNKLNTSNLPAKHRMYSTGDLEILKSIVQGLNPELNERIRYSSLYHSE
jgi:glutamate racemase